MIDRETEALLAATGCTTLIDPQADGAVLFDIGGGSSELVRLNRSQQSSGGPPPPQIRGWISLPYGVVTLAERHGGIIVSREIYEAMVQEVADVIAPFAREHGGEALNGVHMLGTSGTVTTIAGVHLDLKRYDRNRVDGCWMGEQRDQRGDRPATGHELRAARRQSLHRRRARRLGARRLRHPGRYPPRLPLSAPARRRPRVARRHAGADDARRRRMGWRQSGGDVVTARGKQPNKSGPPRALKVRVKSKRRSLSSKLWLERQLNDPYVARAKREGLRSRAAFKLIEIDDKARILKKGARVIDLGAAPGGWSQVAAKRVGAPRAGRVVAIDLLPMEPIAGVDFAVIDFLDAAAPDKLKAMLGGPADVVLSDMAANATGHAKTDHLKIMALVEAAADFAREVLAPGGSFLAKVLQGGTEAALLAALKRDFATVKHVKPAASRSDSAELYLLATGFRG